MNTLYLLLNLGSISVPFLYSFHPKLKFYKNWKYLIIAIIVSSLLYIPWDILFTNKGIWGFNDTYFLGLKLFNLPIEEWLFFICIPYACVFTHYALSYYFPNKELSKKTTTRLSYFLVVIFTIVVLLNYQKWYTATNFTYAIILILGVQKFNIVLLQKYYLTFIIMLVPFLIVNGVLTGSFIENEVVWYNNAENLNFRIFTIPIEDFTYAFTLILTNLSVVEYSKKLLIK